MALLLVAIVSGAVILSIAFAVELAQKEKDDDD